MFCVFFFLSFSSSPWQIPEWISNAVRVFSVQQPSEKGGGSEQRITAMRKFRQDWIWGEGESQASRHFTGRFLVSPDRLHLLCLVCSEHKLFHWEFSPSPCPSRVCQRWANRRAICPVLWQHDPKFILFQIPAPIGKCRCACVRAVAFVSVCNMKLTCRFFCNAVSKVLRVFLFFFACLKVRPAIKCCIYGLI